MCKPVRILQVLSILAATVIIALSILLIIGVITPVDFYSFTAKESYSSAQDWN